ncbi:MAG: hypothetical protein NC131_16415 [Roseburia sp.]|nr:hypothetical protein [Roseburia sp.]
MASLAVKGGVGSFISLKQGKKMSSRPQFVQGLSKNAVPGRTYRLFFPKVKTPEVDEDGNPTGNMEENFMLSYVVGRDLDFEVFNHVSFMTYKNEWFEAEDINSFRDKTGVDSYARIMRAAFEASCEKEKADAEEQAKQLAQQNGGKMDERALYRKLDNIDMKYHGRPAEDGVPRVYASVKPAIGGLHGMLITECLRVPMKTDTNTPDWAQASYHYKRCSSQFIQQLIDIMDNPAYNREGSDYIEVVFKYGSEGQDKGAAGREASFTPVSADLALEKLYPGEWEELGKPKVAGIAGGEREAQAAAEAVMKDAGFSNIRINPQELASTVKKWAANNLVIFTKLNMEAQETARAAKDLVSCGILDGLADIKAKVEQMAEEQGSGSDEEDAQEESTVSTATQQMTPDTAPSQPSQSVDPEHQKKASAAMEELYNSGAVDGRTAGEFLNVPEDDDDLMGDLV